jgi:hypothetical protein
MQYLYILLLGLIIYYIISRYYENYRENFDPSLVPVSSIVTLAKVAQKLVDGGGTLTSPGNLTLGTPSAVGNLIVTGTSTTSGNQTVGGTLGVTGTSTLTGNTTVGGTLGVTGASTVGGNTTVGGTLGVIGASTLTGNTTVGGTLGVTGASTLTGNTTIGGTLGVTGNTTIGGNLTGGNISLTKTNLNTSSATNAELSSDTTNWKSLMILGNTAANNGGRNISMWDNVKINGNTTIGGSLTIGSITLSEVNGQLVISKPISNSGAQLVSPTINGARFIGNQQWTLSGDGRQSDQMFEFRDSNTGARKGWMGWTWGGLGSGYG